MLHVPNRVGGGFPLMAESEEDKKNWMSLLRNVIEGPKVVLDDIPDSYMTYEDERDHSSSFVSN